MQTVKKYLNLSSSKKVNPYKACIYGLCRDFLDGVGYDLGTKLFFILVVKFELEIICTFCEIGRSIR